MGLQSTRRQRSEWARARRPSLGRTVSHNCVASARCCTAASFPFEIAGLILLVAMIGAIVLTHRSRGDARGQNASKQISRRPRDAVQNMQPGVGEGIKL